MSSVMELKGLRKRYEEKGDWILKGIDLRIEKQDFIAIMGRSGCGKTTLLKTLGLIEAATEGEYFFEGNAVSGLWGSEIADIRRRNMGFIFQDYNLMGSRTVRENIMLPELLDKMDEQQRKNWTEKLIQRFGIQAYRDKYPHEMSGGQQQRVALCRALINDPDVILGDEPTGNLDSVMGQQVIETLAEFNETDGKTVILVTHDPKIAMYCRKVIFMKDGHLLDCLERRDAEKETFYRKIAAKMEEL